jgi:hypothetical protein
MDFFFRNDTNESENNEMLEELLSRYQETE